MEDIEEFDEDVSKPAAKTSAAAAVDVTDDASFDADDALSALIKNPPPAVSPPKSAPAVTTKPTGATDANDSGSDWDDSDSDSAADEEVAKATSPVKAAKEEQPAAGETSPRTLSAQPSGRDSATSTASVTSDPNFLNLSVRERLQLRREALKQSRSTLSVTPTEGQK